MSALSGDQTFNPLANIMTWPLANGFSLDGINHGKNHGLRRVSGEMQLDFKYPGWMKFGDEGGKAIDGNLISYIRPDMVAAAQHDWFTPKTAVGLMHAGLLCINQSIRAFVYCILGVRVNVRSSILRERGGAKEAQTEFLTLMEDAIRQPNLVQSVQRYQLAVD